MVYRVINYAWMDILPSYV